VANDLVAPFRLDGFRGEGDPADAAADVFDEIAIGAATEDMTEAEVADPVP
jgi:hypothetical protein